MTTAATDSGGFFMLPGTGDVPVISDADSSHALTQIWDVLEDVAGPASFRTKSREVTAELRSGQRRPNSAPLIEVFIAGNHVGRLPPELSTEIIDSLRRLGGSGGRPIVCRGWINDGWGDKAPQVRLDFDPKYLSGQPDQTLSHSAMSPTSTPVDNSPGRLGSPPHAFPPPDPEAVLPAPTRSIEPPAAATALSGRVGLEPPPANLPRPDEGSAIGQEDHQGPVASTTVRLTLPDADDELVAYLEGLLKELSDLETQLLEAKSPNRSEIENLHDQMHESQVLAELGAVPSSSLSNVKAVARSYPTAADLMNLTESRLMSVRGIGEVKAGAIHAAVNQMVKEAERRPLSIPFPDDLTEQHRDIVHAVGRIYQSTQLDQSTIERLSELRGELGLYLKRAKKATDRKWKLVGKSRRAEDRERLRDECQQWLEQPGTSDGIVRAHEAAHSSSTPDSLTELRTLYRERFADFVAVAEELGVQPGQGADAGMRRQRSSRVSQAPSKPFERRHAPARPNTYPGGPKPVQIFTDPSAPGWSVPPGGDSKWGGVPADLAQEIERLSIRTDGLKVTLRPYQRFAVGFAAMQKRIVLGDEMGLGKTIEALALMAHIRATEGEAHFVVVCPASIVMNWAHEIEHRSDFRMHMAYGRDREQILRQWHQEGGIALTSYATARTMGAEGFARRIALVVADECHYVKNPDANRTRVFAAVAQHADRVVLMSGTPMENRVEEFVDIIRLANRAHAERLELELSTAFDRQLDFRRDVAPVYLRRKQDDVLHELPRLIETDDWLELSPQEMSSYVSHESQGSLMSIRRWTSTANGEVTAKLSRLDELLNECREEGRKVVVFSYFLDVLDAVTTRVPNAFRVDGKVSPTLRLQLIDEFSGIDGFAVLASQIVSGGVGLNIQAANVVILMEPQLKPTTEWQAIARVYRMGQTRTVLVHRLLALGTIDEDLFELVSEKAKAFNAFADESALKDESDMAVASTDGELKAVLSERIRARQLAS